MGFLHQLRVLLWKNFVLKKRSLVTVVFEILIPLALFVILLFIRKQQPSKRNRETYFTAMPLPSSGIIPVLQTFCPSFQRDSFGFPDHPNSGVEDFLNRLDKLVRGNNLFNDDFSLEHIEVELDSFHNLVNDKGSLEQRFAVAKGFSLNDMVKNSSVLVRYLVGNLSIPESDAHQIMHKNLNLDEIFRLLYGFHPETVDFSDTYNSTNSSYNASHNASDFATFLQRRFKGRCCGAVSKHIPDDELFSYGGLLGLLSLQPVGFLEGLGYTSLAHTAVHTGDNNTLGLGQEYVKWLLSPSELQDIVCNEDTINALYDSDAGHFNSSGYVVKDLCNRQDAPVVFDELSQVLKEQLDLGVVFHKLNVTNTDLDETRRKAIAVIKQLAKFAKFQETLNDLYNFALDLPGDNCPNRAHDVNVSFPSPSYQQPSTFQTTLIQPFIQEDQNPFSGDTSDIGNVSDWFSDVHNLTEDGMVTPVLNTESLPNDEGTQDKEAKPKQDEKSKKLALMYKLWAKMQPGLCGEKLRVNDEALARGDLKALHLTSHQRSSIGLLLHVLFSNPRILYAPNTTDVNDLIDKASDILHLMRNITHYALLWRNISEEIRSYMHMESTQIVLSWLGQMEDEYANHPLLFKNLTMMTSSDLGDLLANHTYINVTSIEKRLDVIDNAACGWLNLAGNVDFNVYQPFEDEETLIDYILNHQAVHDNVTVFASLVFEVGEDGKLPPHIIYKIRQNTSFTDRSDLIRRRFWAPWSNHKSRLGYYTYGFVWIQDIIERAIVNKWVGHRVVEPANYVQEFPYPCYIRDYFMFRIEHILPIMLVVPWVYYVAMFTQSIVYEKEVRLKEVMKMMGLSNAVHWVAWFIIGFTQMSLTIAALIAILLYGKIFIYSNPVIVWLTLTVFAMATISFCFLVSVLFSKAKLASACAGVIYFTSYFPGLYIAIREESLAQVDISSSLKTLASLLSTSAFGLGARYFALYEENGAGVQWNNIALSPVEHDSFNLLRVIFMLLVDTVLYCLLTWYIEGVHPGSYGLPRPWYFPLQYSYWFGHQSGHHTEHCSCWNFLRKRNQFSRLSVVEDAQAETMENVTNVYMEPDPTHLPLGVSIDKLTKVYEGTKKRAVNKLSLKFYEGQITSFLGHNGAGKTTTISMLTGLFPPTSGTAHIYGSDIQSDMTTIRKSLGMCPQHNALFERLTVEEHIWFYCLLKGVPSTLIKSEITKIITDIGLLEKRHSVVNTLSGGMQRKLSVAIAFVGGSRTVILDEPTAGIDPCARRAIWDLLMKYKQGRTIILCTHHMDEADILGDRIAILSHGELKCVGSSLFLKSMFGDGYQLTLIKKPTKNTNDSNTSQTNRAPSQSSPRSDAFVSSCCHQDITRFIQRHIARARLTSETLRELTYRLPSEAAQKDCLESLFAALSEERLDTLGLSGYGLMDSSLEEVFLKVADEYGVNRTDGESDSQSHDQSSLSPSVTEHPIQRRFLDPATSLGAMELSNVSGSSQTHSRTAQGYTSLPQDQLNGPSLHQGGIESHILTGFVYQLAQFSTLMIKRFHYTRRNRKGLFTQLLLPAFFVCIAMSVALSAPKVGNFPPLVLTPSQYHPLTYPGSTYSIYANEALNKRRTYHIYRSMHGDADPTQLTATFKYPAGLGASCVLKTPWNGTLDRLVQSTNYSSSVNLRAKYFDRMCQESFKKGKPLSNYVPEIPHELPPPEEAEFDDGDMAMKPKGTTYIKEKTCRCAQNGNGFICPPNVGKPEPDSLKVITSDILLDISGRNVSEYLLYTTDKFRLKRYGGISFGNVRTFVPAKYSNIVPDTYRMIAVRNAAITWFSHKGYHSLPTYINALNNAILRANLDPNIHGNPSAYGITAINHPVNKTGWQLEEEFINRQSTDVLIAIFIIVAMSFVPASFVVFLVIERSSKAKHLQYVSGMSPLIYWLANFTWDMMTYILPASCCILILILFDVPAYSSRTNLPGVIVLFILYGFSMTPIMYPASFVFSESSSAYVVLIVMNLFTGVTSIITTFILEIFNRDEDLKSMYTRLDKLFFVFPNYCLGKALMDLSFNEYMNEYYYNIGLEEEMQSPYQWELLYRIFVIMASEGILAFIFTLLCEYRFFIKPRATSKSSVDEDDMDDDIKEEKERVLSGLANDDALYIKHLSKMYKTKRFGSHLAVDKLFLGVPQGECFGLLGVNGAGKTTTFKMITGDESISEGDAVICGYSVYKDIRKVQQLIGYCPQFDALFDELTAREHLTHYARLKGIPRSQCKKVVDWAIKRVALDQYANKPAREYSGGIKRKLSTAIALLGHPRLIFMDEPTTGMDPHSRRFLWDLIRSITLEGRSVILTSHSMEECEVLCSRLAIMVNGRLRCLGSAQHLKNKFGDGYTVTIRVGGRDPNTRRVVQFFQQVFPNAVLKEVHHSILQYEIPLEFVNLRDLFCQLQNVQDTLGIDDYSISQMTLDNVFVNFAKQQMEKQRASESENQRRQTRRKQKKLPTSSEMEPFLLDDEFNFSNNDLGCTCPTEPSVNLSVKDLMMTPLIGQWRWFMGKDEGVRRRPSWIGEGHPGIGEVHAGIDESDNDDALLDLGHSEQEVTKCPRHKMHNTQSETRRQPSHTDDEPLLHTESRANTQLYQQMGLVEPFGNECLLENCDDDDVMLPLDDSSIRLSLMDVEV